MVSGFQPQSSFLVAGVSNQRGQPHGLLYGFHQDNPCLVYFALKSRSQTGLLFVPVTPDLQKPEPTEVGSHSGRGIWTTLRAGLQRQQSRTRRFRVPVLRRLIRVWRIMARNRTRGWTSMGQRSLSRRAEMTPGAEVFQKAPAPAT